MKPRVYHPIFSNLVDPNLEADYKQNYARSLIRMVRFSLYIFLVVSFLLIISDIFITNIIATDVAYVFYLRVFMALYIAFILYIINKSMPYHRIELMIFALYICMAGINYLGHYAYPYPEENLYTKEIMVTLLIYLIFPVNIRYQLIGGILFALSNFASLSPDVQSTKTFYHTSVMLFNCNVIGFFISRHYQRNMRRLFYAYLMEDEVQSELIVKMSELQKYSGIAPICNTCYSVRDDKGYWDNLEHFISEHSEATFTHSICPDCTQKMMDEFKDEERQKKDDS